MIEDIIFQMQNIGVFDILLPFLFVFALVFGLLEKTKILGADKRNVNVIVSLILGLLFLTQFEIVQTMNSFLPKVSLFMIISVMFLLLITFFGANFHDGKGPSNITLFIIWIVVLLALYWALSPSLGMEIPYFLQDISWASTVIGIVLIFVMIYYLVKRPSSPSPDSPSPEEP